MIDAAARARFAEEGFLLCPGAVPRGECDDLNAHLSATIARVAAEIARGARHDPGFWPLLRRSAHGLEVFWGPGDRAATPPEAWERFVMRVGHGLHRVDARFEVFCRGAPVGPALAAVVPAPAVLVQSAIIYKQPESDQVQFGLHQDASYLTAEPDTLALAFVALDDMDEENGCLEVVPGSHREGLGTRLVLGDRGFAPAGREVRPPAAERSVRLAAEKGALILVHGRTYHGSAPNRSRRPRRALIAHAMSGGSRMLPTSWVQAPEGGFSRIEPA